MTTPSLIPQNCVCCGQRVQLYRRKLSDDMVRCLVGLYRITKGVSQLSPEDAEKAFYSEGGTLWVHKDLFCSASGSGDYAKMRFWGLIVPRDYRAKEENASGFWAITERGLDFVEKRARVPLYVYVYNNAAHSVSPQTIGVSDASPFDYRETLGL